MGITQIVVPRGFLGPCEDDTPLENALRAIALAAPHDHGEWANKYGTNYESEVFTMHRYCWCDRDDCPWCWHEAPNFWYKPTDFKVTWYKYIGRSMECNRDLSDEEVATMLQDCLRDIAKGGAHTDLPIGE